VGGGKAKLISLWHYWIELCGQNKLSIDVHANLKEWKQVIVDERPVQKNSSDCGVFLMMYMDFLLHDLPLRFGQEDAKNYRWKILQIILHENMNVMDEGKM